MLNKLQTNNTARNLADATRSASAQWHAADRALNDEARATACDRLDLVRAQASWHQATNPEEAVIQIAVLHSLLDSIADYRIDYIIEKAVRDAGRLTVSLARFVEHYGSVDRCDLGADYWMAPQFDEVAFGAIR